jgi:hypothetical protein
MKGINMDTRETKEMNYYETYHKGEIRKTYGELIELVELHCQEQGYRKDVVFNSLLKYNHLDDVKVGDPCCECGNSLTFEDIKSILVERMTSTLGGDVSWTPDSPDNPTDITNDEVMEHQLCYLLDDVLSRWSPYNQDKHTRKWYEKMWWFYDYNEKHQTEMIDIVSNNCKTSHFRKKLNSPVELVEFREYLYQVMKEETYLPLVMNIIRCGGFFQYFKMSVEGEHNG